MPRTHLTEKFCKSKLPPPNYLSELLKRYKKAQKISDEQIASQTGTCRKTVSTRINQKPDDWNIGDLKRYCAVLNVPFGEALDAIVLCQGGWRE